MKTTVIAATIGAFFVSHISAQCVCDPNDTHCLNRCVADTNQCVSECASNTECYSRCIEYHWPGADSTTYENLPTPSWSESATFPTATSSPAFTQPAASTTSAWYGSSSSVASWSQSGTWTSVATWSASQTGIVSSATPSTSGASNLKISQAIAGMTLAAAAYFMC